VTAYLLDVNVLVALAWPSHVHHAAARAWFSAKARAGWATCPLTQLAFVRISSNPAIIRDAVRPGQSHGVLKEMTAHPGHRFWSDDINVAGADFVFSTSLAGHRQVTDAYLLALARHNKGRLATFDRGLPVIAATPALVELI
jgi:hypothetical protein